MIYNLKVVEWNLHQKWLLKPLRKNVKIAEIPITYYPREGESKLSSFADGWRHLRFMMLYRPTPFLLGPGLIALAVGIILTLTVAIQGVQDYIH